MQRDNCPASSGIRSQIRYKPPPKPVPEVEVEQAAAIIPPATAEALGLGFRLDAASVRVGTSHHKVGKGSPSSSQVVRVPASSSQAL